MLTILDAIVHFLTAFYGRWSSFGKKAKQNKSKKKKGEKKRKKEGILNIDNYGKDVFPT